MNHNSTVEVLQTGREMCSTLTEGGIAIAGSREEFRSVSIAAVGILKEFEMSGRSRVADGGTASSYGG
jgi:hypothetical protein